VSPSAAGVVVAVARRGPLETGSEMLYIAEPFTP
jgi:hypothetical protein